MKGHGEDTNRRKRNERSIYYINKGCDFNVLMNEDNFRVE